MPAQRAGLTQALGLMIKISRRLMSATAMLVAPLYCFATLPRSESCHDTLCFSVVEGEPGLIKDRTYYYQEGGRRLLLTRMANGSELSLLLRPVSQADCPGNFEDTYARLARRTGTAISSRGCLAVEQSGKFFRIDFTLVSPKAPLEQELRTLAPQAWIYDFRNPSIVSPVLVLSPSGHEP